MDIGAVFLILTVVLLAGLFISRPFLASQPQRALGRPRSAGQDDESQRSRWQGEYEGYLRSLQELDFDQALGKIPDGDYPAQRQELLQAAAKTLRQLDAVKQVEPQHLAADDATEPQHLAADHATEPQHLAADHATETQGIATVAAETQDIAVMAPETQGIASLPAMTAEDRIEAAIASRRAAVKTRNIATDQLENMIAERRRSRQEKSNGFCPRCGKPVQKSDRFCPKCGKQL